MSNVVYSERLRPGLGVQLAATLAAPMTFLAIAPFGIPAATVAAATAVLLLMTLLQLRAPTITLSSETLKVARVALPVYVIGECEPLRGEAAFKARGPQLDPRAARVIIGDIDGAVRVQIIDESDPTPYLLISSRSPEQLCAAIRSLPR